MATPVSDFAIATTGLSKQYRGGVLAVDQVDLRVARGEIYAFLGLNGAGKSTTIRMLLGMIRPTAGHAELFGERVHSGATDLWRRVGHLVESATAYQELTVRENLDIARRLAGMPDASGVDRVLERLALQPYADRLGQLGVAADHGEVAVAEDLLEGVDVAAIAQEGDRERVAAGVRRDPDAGHAELGAEAAHPLVDGVVGQGPAVAAEQERIAGSSQVVRPLASQVAAEGGVEGPAVGDGPLVVALAEDAELAVADVRVPQAGRLVEADAGVEEDPERDRQRRRRGRQEVASSGRS